MDVPYIAQGDVDGCLVACVAMVTGCTYEEIRARVAPSYQGGIHTVIAHDLLADLGYAVMVRYRHIPHLRRDREVWPCPPFAPVHICGVNVPSGHHAVVLRADGRVLDPWNPARTSLAHPDYRSVDHIDGIFKVR